MQTVAEPRRGPRISDDLCPLVFRYLADARDPLRQLTLTCSTFRCYAQPLLFRKVTFRPYQTYVQFQRQSKHHFAFLPADLEWQHRRLAFLTSAAIAPAVRHVHILPSESWVQEVPAGRVASQAQAHGRDRDNKDDHLYGLLDAILGVLPAFANLRECTFSHLDLRPHQIALLSRVPLFRKLVIVGCSAPQDTPAPHLLAVAHLQITPSLDTSGLSHVWLSAIRLDVVSTLYFSTNESTHSFLTAARAGCMHALRSLDIHITHASTAHILSVLAALPALEILNITNFFREPTLLDLGPSHSRYAGAGSGGGSGPGHLVLPALHHYNGPLNILLHLRLPALDYLNIGGLSETIPAEPDALLRSLPVLQDTLRRVTSLGFAVLFITDALARNLFSLLPPEANVECLRFFVCNPRPTAALEIPPTDALQSICTSMINGNMPRNLQKVHVFFYILSPTRPPPAIDYIDIKNTLSAKCAALRCLWFQRANDVFFWCRNAGGKESLSHATNPEYATMFDEA